MNHYSPPSPENWQGRTDGPEAKRFHEVVRCHNTDAGIPAEGFALIGFACDEGIRRNQGRVGAAQGPLAFRHALSNLPAPFSAPFYDLGDITCTHNDLEEAQQALAELISKCHEQKVFPIVIGGGHEVAWGHYLGLSHHYESCAIVNIDAHFDLRPVDPDGTSGNSFTQIAQLCKKRQRAFDYTCLGIQKLGNSDSLFKQAQELNVTTVSAETFHLEGITPALQAIEGAISRSTQLYLTICLDAFAAPYAPGVSAPQPLGLQPWHVIPLIKAASKHMVSLDIAELSPPYDRDNRTAQLAAQLVATFLIGYLSN